MTYQQLIQHDPQLARRLLRATTPPGSTYHCGGRVYRRKYTARGAVR